ncbi:MAG TPA: hypothetical protein VMO26_30495 [Vicinamibacterales bacterium]|nr:hypothetical protein [Vicinamibacterales bacterium]
MTLKDCLKRGALVTAANWHVVLVQFAADALFKALLAVPVVGGVFLVVLLIGGNPSDLLALPRNEIIPTIASVLLAQPVALAAFLLAVALVLVGGSLLMFLIKGGTVSVLVAAERGAGAIEYPPLRLPAFHRATHFTLERFTNGAAALFRRYLSLGIWLMVIYALSTVASLALVLGPGDSDEDWRLLAVGASAGLVVWITLVNFVYLLFQIVIATDDCSVREAAVLVGRLLRTRFRLVFSILVATAGLVVLTTAASILAAAALGLIAFVPLVGLAALPLQLMAWLLRGVVFQYIGLTALVSHARVYRSLRDPAAVAVPDNAGAHIAH